jgi:tyrosyl-tRNA synthetase
MPHILDTLKERELLDSVTHEDTYEFLKTPRGIYIGFDPTADSLHLGNMIPSMVLSWFQKHGHNTTALVGGATGLIGDPSGKSQERPLLNKESLEVNLKGIQKNIEIFLDFNNSEAKAQILNNYSWFENYQFIDFLRDVGKYFRLGSMLGKESVRSRLESPEGMSFTEFSYQLLQAYDFLHLAKHHNTCVQAGGSDQWGNITAGTDLIKKQLGTPAHGVTFPLLTRSDGKKFGKTEQGTIWLSEKRLPPYDFYQYLYRTPDADVISLMRRLTFMSMEDIHEQEMRMKDTNYETNSVQKRLAQEVTKIVHKEKGLETALKVTNQAKPGSQTELNKENLEALSQQIPCFEFPLSEVIGKKLIDILATTGLCQSKGQARRLISQGGVYLNNNRCSDDSKDIDIKDVIFEKWLLIALGKKKKALIVCK